MIIECARCRTTYRFDETSIEKDGIWVRCSRCRHVFFQDLPDRMRELPRPMRDADTDEEVRGERAEGVSDDASLSGEELWKTEGDGKTVDISGEEWEEEDLERVTEDREEAAPDEGEEEKPKGKSWPRLTLYVLIALLLAAGIYLWLFPQVRLQVIDRFATLPMIDRFFAKKQPAGEAAPVQVALKDVRQRHVANVLLGPLRVIEGAAVSQADYPLTRIAVRGELFDASATVLAERVSFCGNILSDQELTTMTEEEIQKELSLSQGSDIANDRIEPGGQIPFMIVFAREPPGVIKTAVVPAAAERLLP